ncbi:pyridoxamine 5'-phosphate oxidase family protein [Pseudaminobacter arsenicus]|uniref:Pyridoxamine 5'-phosphate oxidase family protein n=1 Tax=Borborobacter arsenicus TaxID=1851146 RepID=A0A432V173_9HYPH|nr:pyridoxamine 5'-phosphate oxidase family protein [Pseudaminobacter arsenicus]RUM95964.1 pyridoxamine 5'-phosphate oxidase family protein [Pseudaminobacter arsenicus]
MRIRSLSTLECTEVLNLNRLGRLGCAKDGRPYVVPFYFAHDDNYLYAFSMVGKKIEWMRLNPRVSVLVEEHVQGREWKSVIVDGRYEELPDRIGHIRERDHAWSLLSRHFDWWEPGSLKLVTPPLSDHSDHVFFRIWIEQLSGREIKEDE